MKEVTEYVWPVENYTDKIHSALKAMFSTYPHLSFTVDQMLPFLVKGYSWLANPTERQTDLLKQIIKTGITKLIQTGKVKKVHSKLTVDSQWQNASAVAESGMVNITSEDSVAHTDDALKAIGRRAIGARALWKFNKEQPKFGILH
jgi:hypothetical protein